MNSINVRTLNRVSIVSTLVDAAIAFARGRNRSGIVLLGAAALGSRVPGLGTAVSLFLRVVRWAR